MDESLVISKLESIQSKLDKLTEKVNALAINMKICVDAADHRIKVDHFKNWPTEEALDKFEEDELREFQNKMQITKGE